ncbi:membrane protein [Zafaria cholistanensis]|uniref:Membrane protein n=1 Tax=Zafaria cholistanensis TaxID=1682741 RepID=A0A5A7NR59_9MICC|nr:DMT family transporter [Zafaria cholistanensis]GER22612.1 membrane protein [Zafaria cholistanensis]
MASTTKIPLPLGIALGLVAGIAIPGQSRINGQLALEMGDGLGAALLSFSVGLVLMAVLSLALRRGRSGLAQLRHAVRERRFPLWYMAAGCVGAYFVLGQGFAAPFTGLALFTVANVTGLTVSGLLVDRLGIGPGGRKDITGIRIIGSVLTVGAVVWTVSPRMGGEAGDGPQGLLLLLLPLTAGFLMSFQQAMNGTATVHYGTPLTATLVNFLAGWIVLLAAWLALVAPAGWPRALPDAWWYYLGGPLGCIFIGLGAVVVRHLGVLLAGLSMVSGQLLGSLALDLVFPAPGSVVTGVTVLGTALTLLAVSVAALPAAARMPWERR